MRDYDATFRNEGGRAMVNVWGKGERYRAAQFSMTQIGDGASVDDPAPFEEDGVVDTRTNRLLLVGVDHPDKRWMIADLIETAASILDGRATDTGDDPWFERYFAEILEVTGMGPQVFVSDRGAPEWTLPFLMHGTIGSADSPHADVIGAAERVAHGLNRIGYDYEVVSEE